MKLRYLTLIAISCFFLSACSDDDTTNTISSPIIVDSIYVSKEVAFIDEAVNLSINASGYSDIDFTIDNSAVNVSEISNSNYRINATAAAEVTIEITLSNEDFTEVRNVSCQFYEHGYKDLTVIEGITLDEDFMDHVLALHGAPDYVQSSGSTNLFDKWFYFDKGFYVKRNAENKADEMEFYVNQLNMDFTQVGGQEHTMRAYTYEFVEGLVIKNPQSSMSDIVDRFGSPTDKITINNSTVREFYYENGDMSFTFLSDNIDDYEDKKISYFGVH